MATEKRGPPLNTPDSKLIVVSNRGPYRSIAAAGKRKAVRAAGGLVTALDPVLRARGGVWVSAQATDEPQVIEVSASDLDYKLAFVELKRSIQDGFYSGVSNAVLWPLLHSFPSTVRLAEAPFRDYEVANRAFANVILDQSADSDTIWIHDYHLMLVPGMVRPGRPKARMGWFCHVPWPNPDLFWILPWRTQIIEGLLAADVLGFHTEGYARNFLACVERLPGSKVEQPDGIVRYKGRCIQVIVDPVGIPCDEVRSITNDPAVIAEANRIRRSVGGRRIILGVDRLDYTKGIPERLLGYEHLLKNDRRMRDRVAFVQVMVPSRTDVKAYAQLKNEVDRMVGDINGRLGKTGQVPIHYLYRNLDPPALYAHYRAADIGLVTPLRDGMNLVAQEYIAARTDGRGVLILSEFAGAACYLDRALLVNPYDVDAIARRLDEGLAMSETEERSRMVALQREVQGLDVHAWSNAFLSALDRAPLSDAS